MKGINFTRIPSCYFITLLFLALLVTATRAQEKPGMVAGSPGQVSPALIGSDLPDVNIKNSEGDYVSLKKVGSGKPAVLVFYRGGWCPYCSKQLSGLAQIRSDITDMGYQLLGISMDKPSKIREHQSKQDLSFPLYSDHEANAVKALGIAYRVPQKKVKGYLENGIDLEGASGRSHHILPVPTVLIVDGKGKILFKYANPDYQVRLEPDVLISAAKAYHPAR